MSGRADGRTDRGQKDKQMDGCLEEQTDGRTADTSTIFRVTFTHSALFRFHGRAYIQLNKKINNDQ